MKLSINENSKNYVCSVVEIKEIFPIESADKIVRTIIFNNNVVISKNVKIGDKMLYFCSGTKLNVDFCKHNNLLTDEEQNRDKVKGYISHKQFRVKAIKLKGIISDGILLPLNSLAFYFLPKERYSLEIGDEFTELDDITICEKYFVPIKNNGTENKQSKSVKISRLVENQFFLHNDTDNLRKNIDKISPEDIIGIHYKKHGTSVVIGNVLVKKQLNWIKKIISKFVQVVDTEYDIVYSSRKVIKNGYLNTNPNSYYSTDIWGDVKEEIKDKIPKNYTLYGEILGYEKSGSAIQKDYDYGCKQGEYKFYVYRITIVNPDGKLLELSDKQIEEFCEKNGLLYKDTFIYYGKAKDLFNSNYSDIIQWREELLKTLEINFNEKDCYICSNKVPEEGIILRKENSEYYEAYKLKSKRFLLKESELQEQEITNLEDNQIEENG